MKSIRDRKQEIYDTCPHEFIPLDYELELINKEYFNNTLNIQIHTHVETYSGVNYTQYVRPIDIDGRIFISPNEPWDYLQNLYDLQSIKNKINKINETIF